MPKYKQCIIVGVSVSLLGLLSIFLPPVISWEESIGLNILYSMRGSRQPPPEVVVVSIDNLTVEKLKLPQDLKLWNRSVHARVVDVISSEGARVIAFDMLFDESRTPSGDSEFADSIKRAGNVVLSAYMKSMSSHSSGEKGKEIYSIEKLLLPITPLRDSAAAIAAFPLPKVPVQLNQLWTFKTDAGDLPTLPVVAFQIFALEHYDSWIDMLKKSGIKRLELPRARGDPAFKGNIQDIVQATRDAIQNVPQLENNFKRELKKIKGDQAGSIPTLCSLITMYSGPESRYLNFYGPSGTINTFTYHEVFNKKSDAARFTGKAVFIGIAAEGIRPGERDNIYTVFSEDTGSDLSGVEVAATAFANILEDAFIKPVQSGALLLLIIFLGMTLGIISRLFPAAWASSGIILLSIVYFTAAYYLFKTSHIWCPLVTPLLIQAPLALVIGGISEYITVNRQRETIRKISRYYLPDEVINDSARDMAELKARSKEIFGFLIYADIEQYTKFADGRPSREVIEVLNRYCESLFGPVNKSGGRISDFIGDAMVAIWESGAADRDQSRTGAQACRAALEISARVSRFNSESDVQLPVRIGLHAGSMVKGNVGAFNHLERRLVGSSVNEAARLDGLNKHLGTRITVSEEVFSRIESNDLFFRHIGTFFLAGISKPLKVYELIGPDESVSKTQRKACEYFSNGLSCFTERRWEEAESFFKQVFEIKADDGPSSFYLGLCTAYKTTPPSEPWDGSVTLSSK